MLCIYHSKDLDGICCGAILHAKYPEARLLGYDYGQPFDVEEQIEVGEYVIMADVSMPMDKMCAIAERSGGFDWIDHHKTAIADWEALKDKPNRLRAVLQDGISACELTWKVYFDTEMPLAVRLLGEYDTFRNVGTQRWNRFVLPFQYGMRLYGFTPESFPALLLFPDKVIVGSPQSLLDNYIEEGKLILKYQQSQDADICRAVSFTRNVLGFRAICCNGVNGSLAFKSVYNPNEHDIMVSLWYNGEEWSVGLRADKPEIDCGAIAKKMGGGGHRGAAGFKVQNLNTIFHDNDILD